MLFSQNVSAAYVKFIYVPFRRNKFDISAKKAVTS